LASSTLGAGRRYGEERYDERMKAQWVVKIKKSALKETSEAVDALVNASAPSNREEEEEEGDKKRPERDKQPRSQTISKSTIPKKHIPPTEDQTEGQKDKLPLQKNPNIDPSPQPSSASTALTYTTVKSKTQQKDPLQWYGILNPPPLRQAQTHFLCSINTTIPDLLSTISAMQAIEADIWNCRSTLGLSDQYELAIHTNGPGKD
jgi:hypothetical protein